MRTDKRVQARALIEAMLDCCQAVATAHDAFAAPAARVAAALIEFGQVMSEAGLDFLEVPIDEENHSSPGGPNNADLDQADG